MEPCLKPPRNHPAALAQPSWNLTSNHPDHPAAWNPGGTLVEPWWNPGGTLVEPWWNPCGTVVEPSSNQPGPPRSPRRNWWNPGGPYLKPPRTTPQPLKNVVVEPWWKPGRLEPWWNPGGTLVEPWWNLSSGSPRTTPEPIWAETPKLSAAGGKNLSRFFQHPS